VVIIWNSYFSLIGYISVQLVIDWLIVWLILKYWITSSKYTLIDPTSVAPTAVIEKKPYCQWPTYRARSLTLKRPGTHWLTVGQTLHSSPAIKQHWQRVHQSICLQQYELHHDPHLQSAFSSMLSRLQELNTTDGRPPGKTGRCELSSFVGVDLNLWPIVYIVVIVQAWR